MSHTFQIPGFIFKSSPEPFADGHYKRSLHVLHMVGVLHGKGFHGLRILPYEAPLAYRIEIFPSRFAEPDGVRYDAACERDEGAENLIARYSGAATKYFGWDDTESADSHQLALLFTERFPELCRVSYHLDYAYAGWFATLLAHCEYGFMPYLYSEYDRAIGALRMRAIKGEGMECFPLPPSASYGHAFVRSTNSVLR